ncbi:uncharacterized protein ISCGN_027344 [Ixodes scapularis]
MDDNAALANEFELPFSDLTPTEREMLLRTQNSGLATDAAMLRIAASVGSLCKLTSPDRPHVFSRPFAQPTTAHKRGMIGDDGVSSCGADSEATVSCGDDSEATLTCEDDSEATLTGDDQNEATMSSEEWSEAAESCEELSDSDYDAEWTEKSLLTTGSPFQVDSCIQVDTLLKQKQGPRISLSMNNCIRKPENGNLPPTFSRGFGLLRFSSSALFAVRSHNGPVVRAGPSSAWLLTVARPSRVDGCSAHRTALREVLWDSAALSRAPPLTGPSSVSAFYWSIIQSNDSIRRD